VLVFLTLETTHNPDADVTQHHQKHELPDDTKKRAPRKMGTTRDRTVRKDDLVDVLAGAVCWQQ